MKIRVDEFTRSEIMKSIERKVINRSKKLKLPTYIGITRDYTVHMKVDSATGVGSYVVRLKLDEYPSIADLEDLTTKEKVRLALAGDVKMHCDCPAFKWWGYEYITSQLDTNSHSNQEIFPKIRNPKLEGICCKHIHRALKMFGSYWVKIATDIDNMNFIS